jgi:hypothetical protein
MGESLGMSNERHGVAMARWAQRKWDEGDVSGSEAGAATSYLSAFIDATESFAWLPRRG